MLKISATSLDEIPEDYRSACKQTESGTIEFDPDAFVGGLKTALASEREITKEAKALNATLKQLGIPAEQVGRKLSEFQTRAIEAERSEFGTLGAAALEAKLIDKGATSEGLRLLAREYGDRVKVEKLDGKRVVTILSADNKTPMPGSGANGRATFDDLASEAIKAFPGQFKATGMGGGGAPRRQTTLPANTISRADYEKLPPGERASAARSMKIVD